MTDPAVWPTGHYSVASIRLDPHHAEAHYYYALFLEEQEEYVEAKNLLQKTTDIDQNHTRAYYRLARLLTAPDDYDIAKQNYQMAVDIDPDFAEVHYYLGKLLAGGKRIDNDGTLVVEPEDESALEHFRKALEFNQDNYKAHFNIAKILTKEKEYASAQDHFHKALELRPDYPKAHYHLALLLIEMGKLVPEQSEPTGEASAS